MALATAKAGVFRSWGGLIAREARPLSPAAFARGQICGAVLPYGQGRSYGDSCLLDGNALIDMREAAAIEYFDPEQGVVVAEAGLSIGELIRAVGPAGWFVPVTPGTRHVTLGGALANDVHGKNHHVAGTFGRHVLWFELIRSDGSVRRCTPDDNPDLFAATIGGLGLTGLVTRLALRLMPVQGPFLRQDVIPFGSLAEAFALARASDESHAYTVAWIDSLATGKALGRGVFIRANHAEVPGTFEPPKALPFLPFTPPVPLVNRLSMSLFNTMYRRVAGRARTGRLAPYASFFYPLDAVTGWNRAYGPRGLRQHQSALPHGTAEDAVREMLMAAQKAGQASFLTVLKLFGDVPSPGLMSFPLPGATLTLDFAYRGQRTDALLDTLDRIAIAAGGRINPYKDARMSPATFEASFPLWREFARHIDPAFTSNFWRRVAG